MKTLLRLRRLLAVALLFLPSTVSWAYEYEQFEQDGIFYFINPDGASVTVTHSDEEYMSESVVPRDYVIPSSVAYNGKDYSVVAIGYEAFKYCHDLSSVSIPNSVTDINDNAFNGCRRLSTIIVDPSNPVYVPIFL